MHNFFQNWEQIAKYNVILFVKHERATMQAHGDLNLLPFDANQVIDRYTGKPDGQKNKWSYFELQVNMTI